MDPQERLVRALEARDQDPKILADVPVLEKISALRNVALRIGEGNIWGSDIPRAQRAVKLLEQALQLHEKELQNNDHPCQSPCSSPPTPLLCNSMCYSTFNTFVGLLPCQRLPFVMANFVMSDIPLRPLVLTQHVNIMIL